MDEPVSTLISGAGEEGDAIPSLAPPEVSDEIGKLVTDSRATRAQIDDASSRIGAFAKYARVLRPVQHEVQRGLQGFADAQGIFDVWGAGLRDRG